MDIVCRELFAVYQAQSTYFINREKKREWQEQANSEIPFRFAMSDAVNCVTLLCCLRKLLTKELYLLLHSFSFKRRQK